MYEMIEKAPIGWCYAWWMITPEGAEAMLANNASNRAIDQRVVDMYARDMESGNWFSENPETVITVTETGKLKNGQHRLSAIKRSGKERKCIVAVVPDDAPFICDRQKKRTTSNQFAMDGRLTPTLRANVVIGAVNLHLSFMAGKEFRPTDAEIEKELNEHSDAWECAMHCTGYGQNKPLRRADAIHAFYCASRCGVSELDLERFAKIASSGFSNAPTENAAILARNNIQETRGRQASSYGKKIENSAYIQTCLADFLKGSTRTRRYTKVRHIYGDKVRAKSGGTT